MNKRLFLSASVCAVLFSLPVLAAERPQVYFQHADWELACDNTRTCRAAGYHGDDSENGISILLTRPAGPNAPVRVQLQLADTASATPSAVQMHIGRRALGTIRLNDNARGELSAAQTAALLPALLTNATLTWDAEGPSWTVSTKGANAVLLKMDEFQGRLGTPGALARKGTQPESSVSAALPIPEITAAPVSDDKADAGLVPAVQRAALLAELRKTLGNEDANQCDDFNENAIDPQKLTLYRLSSSRLLVSIGCYVGAYNSGDAYWVINPRPPFLPVLATNTGSDYAHGQIFFSQRGRGIGDCMSSDTWTWDGRQFVHTSSLSTGMCKEIMAGGAWELPTLVTKVNQPR
jgi:hypothetical protein